VDSIYGVFVAAVRFRKPRRIGSTLVGTLEHHAKALSAEQIINWNNKETQK